MANYLFNQAKTSINNNANDLFTGVFYAHLVTSIPNNSIFRVSQLMLPANPNYKHKILTGLFYDGYKLIFNNTSWSPLNYQSPPVGTVICKQSGSIPVSRDRVICYSSHSQILGPGTYGINQIFPTNGILNILYDN